MLSQVRHMSVAQLLLELSSITLTPNHKDCLSNREDNRNLNVALKILLETICIPTSYKYVHLELVITSGARYNHSEPNF